MGACTVHRPDGRPVCVFVCVLGLVHLCDAIFFVVLLKFVILYVGR